MVAAAQCYMVARGIDRCQLGSFASEQVGTRVCLVRSQIQMLVTAIGAAIDEVAFSRTESLWGVRWLRNLLTARSTVL